MQRTAAWRISVLSLPISLMAVVSPLAAQAEAHTMAHAHMSFSPAQPASPADTARALALLETLRNSLAPYQTLEAAEAAGYVPARSPESVKEGKLLHAGRRPRRLRSQGTFDPANPQALLFEKDASGAMKLSGAMFVAPPAASLADLDAMVPLGVARWHQHTNVCVAADRAQSRRIVKATTEEECTRLGGRFRAQSRFMVHVMTGVGNDLALAFPQRPDPDDDMTSGHSMAPMQ
jgi:hypothetical protein